MAINSGKGTVDCSVLIGEDKENFVQRLLHKQLELLKFMCSIYSNGSISQDQTILMEAVKKSIIPKTLAERLNNLCSIFSDISFGDG